MKDRGINRRQFIKNTIGTAAAVSFTYVIPASALGKAGNVAPSNRITMGCTGNSYWVWNFISIQRCVADSTVYQIIYRYGGFGFRCTTEWEGENAMYPTSDGRNHKDGHAIEFRWCDMRGSMGNNSRELRL